MTIPQELINNALALTGKKYEDMYMFYEIPNDLCWTFSIEKFCYYLLSPEFIDKFIPIYQEAYSFNTVSTDIGEYIAKWIGIKIYQYQKKNEQPLIDLLSKI